MTTVRGERELLTQRRKGESPGCHGQNIPHLTRSSFQIRPFEPGSLRTTSDVRKRPLSSSRLARRSQKQKRTKRARSALVGWLVGGLLPIPWRKDMGPSIVVALSTQREPTRKAIQFDWQSDMAGVAFQSWFEPTIPHPGLVLPPLTGG